MTTPPLTAELALASQLSELTAYELQISCCRGVTVAQIRHLVERQGDMLLSELIPRLRCRKCGSRAKSVHLGKPYNVRVPADAQDRWSLHLAGDPDKWLGRGR